VNHRWIITTLATAAALEGCGTPRNAGGNVPAVTAAIVTAPSSKEKTGVGARHDLVYVAAGGTVYAYTFPNIRKSAVSSISIIARGLCSDSDGSLWASIQSPRKCSNIGTVARN
jgi:hypothetical protein